MGIPRITPRMAPTGRISAFTATTTSTAGNFSVSISAGNNGEAPFIEPTLIHRVFAEKNYLTLFKTYFFVLLNEVKGLKLLEIRDSSIGSE
jgi:hypothetical protein